MTAIAHAQSHRIDRIMVNTDSGRDLYDDLVTYRYAQDLPEEMLPAFTDWVTWIKKARK